MAATHFGLVGLIGILVFFAGGHLLWKSREEALYWVVKFVQILRGEFSRHHGVEFSPAAPASAAESRVPRRRGALLMASALLLIFIGPILVLLDLTF